MNVSSASGAVAYSAMQTSATPASCGVRRCHGDDGSGHGKQGERVRGAGGFGRLINSVFQALAQTAAAPANPAAPAAATPATPATSATGDTAAAPATSTPGATGGADPAQDILQRVATFMQNLFAAMGQMGGQDHGHDHGHGHHRGHCHDDSAVGAAAPAVTPPASAGVPTTATPATGATPVANASATGAIDAATTTPPVTTSPSANPARLYAQHEHRGGLVPKLQSLLQQVSNGSAATATPGPLADLNTAFQNLFSALHPADSEGTATPPTLQDFLQKLVQNIRGSGADTGAATGGLINTTA